MTVVCKDMNRAQAILDSDDPAMQKQIAKPLHPNDWNNRGKEIMIPHYGRSSHKTKLWVIFWFTLTPGLLRRPHYTTHTGA